MGCEPHLGVEVKHVACLSTISTHTLNIIVLPAIAMYVDHILQSGPF